MFPFVRHISETYPTIWAMGVLCIAMGIYSSFVMETYTNVLYATICAACFVSVCAYFTRSKISIHFTGIAMTIGIMLGIIAITSSIRWFFADPTFCGYPASPTISDPPFRIVAVIAMVIATGMFEECLFRGVIQESFERAYRRKGTATVTVKTILTVSLLFAILHIGDIDPSTMGIITYPIAMIATKVITAFAFSIVMGHIYASTHSLMISICVHAIYDFIDAAPSLQCQGQAFLGGYVWTGVGTITSLALAVAMSLLACYCLKKLWNETL